MIRSVRIGRSKLALALIVLAAAALVALPAVAHAAGSWRAQDPGSATGTALISVSFPDSTHGWAVGDLGTIMHTTDGGTTWTAQHSGILDGTMLSSVDFIDVDHGWVVGGNGKILSTANGGATWTARTSGITDGSGFSGVDFVDATHGWAVGDLGLIVHTTNGGTTWSAQDSRLDDGSSLWGVTFSDARHGWAVGDNGTILSTADGGATWTPRDSGVTDGSSLSSVAFADASNGWAVGGSGTIVVTTDGGATWTPQDSGVADGRGFYGVAFVDDVHGWAVGDSGLIVVTDDGGTTWTPQDSGLPEDSLYGVTFIDATHGWAVGDAGGISAFGTGSAPAPVPDVTPPTTLILVDPPATSGWNDTPVMVDLEATDNFGGSGVTEISYTLDGVPLSYDSPFEISDEGVHLLSYHSIDASGNAELAKAATIRVDLTAPDLSLDATASYTGSASIRALAVDGLSGLARVEMRVDRGAWARTALISTSAPGTHTVDARAFDIAGNEADTSATFTVVWPRLVATTTRLNAASSVKVRHSLKLTGTVRPAGAPGRVTITKTRLVRRKWKSAGSATVAVKNGSYTYTFKPTVRGSWRFVARYSGSVVGSTTCRPSKSATKTVKVK